MLTSNFPCKIDRNQAGRVFVSAPGIDWGATMWVIRDHAPYYITYVPGHSYWSGIGQPRSYMPSCYFLIRLDPPKFKDDRMRGRSLGSVLKEIECAKGRPRKAILEALEKEYLSILEGIQALAASEREVDEWVIWVDRLDALCYGHAAKTNNQTTWLDQLSCRDTSYMLETHRALVPSQLILARAASPERFAQLQEEHRNLYRDQANWAEAFERQIAEIRAKKLQIDKEFDARIAELIASIPT